MMTKKNLAKAVTLSVLLMLPYGMAQAATYTEAISGADDRYTEAQKTYNDSTNTYTYTLGDGAVLNLKTNNVDRNANSIGIHANNEKIVINGALDIKMQKGEENNSGSVRNAILVEGTNSLVDRRAGGNIEITSDTRYGDNGAVLLTGSNNKIYLGKGNITLTRNEGMLTSVMYVNGENNLLVYGGKGKITYCSSGDDEYSTTGKGVKLAYDENNNNNKIILGYAGDYSENDLGKFNNLDMLPNAVNELETVTIEVKATNNNLERNALVNATGIEVSGFGSTAKEDADNIIAAGDLIIKTIAEKNGRRQLFPVG